MHGQKELIELLDRRYKLVADITDPAEFLLELNGFLGFIQTDRKLWPHVELLVNEYQRRERGRDLLFDAQLENVIELRHKLVVICPGLDDSDMDLETLQDPPRPSEKYLRSLAYFDNLVNNIDVWDPNVTFYPMNVDLYGDSSKVGQLLRILENKFYQECNLEDELLEESYEALRSDFRYLYDQHLYIHRDFVNYCRIAPGVSLGNLLELTQLINPIPTRHTTRSDYILEIVKNVMSVEGRFATNIQEIVYGQRVTNVSDVTTRNDLIVFAKLQLRRFYEGLRASIGSQLAFQRIIELYKIRSEEYERIDLLNLIEEHIESQTRENKRLQLEDLLTRQLALYLYDNGYPVHYRLRAGGQEPDLLSKEGVPENVVVEAKVVGQNRGEGWIIEGIRALHSYLEKCYSEYDVTLGYLIIFRVGEEELFSFEPQTWQIGHFQIIPKLINLGGTSKQANPILIRQEDIISK